MLDADAAQDVRRVADLRLRGRSGVMPVRVRWPSSATAEYSPPVMVFLPDARAAGGVDAADDELCHELCRRSGMVVLCAPWALERAGRQCADLDRAALVLDWCADHAWELGADAETLVLAGRGAGAAAAVALARRSVDRGWPRIAHQLLIVSDPPSAECEGRLRATRAEFVTEHELLERAA